MGTPVSRFKESYKTFSFEPLHVNLSRTPANSKDITIPVEDLTIDQNFSPEYTQQHAYGRMDPIPIYQKTGRTLSIGFACRAHHIIDGPGGVVNNVRNINLLTQLLYPAYFKSGYTINDDPVAILGAPPFFRIKYGNYVGSYSSTGELGGPLVQGLTGYITGFNHRLGTIAKNVAFGKQGKENEYRALPREIKVSFTFVVVHDQLVGWHDGQFSPWGYGNNFPYNAGEFGELGSDARTGNFQPQEHTAGNANSAAGGPTTKEERDANPHGVPQTILNAQTDNILGGQAGAPRSTLQHTAPSAPQLTEGER